MNDRLPAAPSGTPAAQAGLLGVVSDSMAPTLLPGDAVRLEPCDPGALRWGDLVVFRRAGGRVVHRLIGRDAAGLLTQGDNRWRPDPPVPAESVEGRVAAILRPGWPARATGATFRLRGRIRHAWRRFKFRLDFLSQRLASRFR